MTEQEIIETLIKDIQNGTIKIEDIPEVWREKVEQALKESE